MTTVILILFYQQLIYQLLVIKWVFKHQDLQMIGFEVVGRARDTTSSWWQFKQDNVAGKGLTCEANHAVMMISDKYKKTSYG